MISLFNSCEVISEPGNLFRLSGITWLLRVRRKNESVCNSVREELRHYCLFESALKNTKLTSLVLPHPCVSAREGASQGTVLPISPNHRSLEVAKAACIGIFIFL